MTQLTMAYYANLLFNLDPPADLGDERSCIELLRQNKVPEDIINQHLEQIIEIARSL